MPAPTSRKRRSRVPVRHLWSPDEVRDRRPPSQVVVESTPDEILDFMCQRYWIRKGGWRRVLTSQASAEAAYLILAARRKRAGEDVQEDGMSEADWHGKHLTEDEIVEDLLARIRAEPGALESWTNWHPAHWFTLGAQVRNWYGLWRKDCPLTKAADGHWLAPDADDVLRRASSSVFSRRWRKGSSRSGRRPAGGARRHGRGPWTPVRLFSERAAVQPECPSGCRSCPPSPSCRARTGQGRRPTRRAGTKAPGRASQEVRPSVLRAHRRLPP